MKEQFCTYKIALALKELGFDEECCALYRKDRLFTVIGFEKINSIKQSVIAAPLWQQAWSFLNDKYGIFITIALVANGYGFYIHKDFNTTNKGENYGFYPTIYEAREAAILKAIELCKKI